MFEPAFKTLRSLGFLPFSYSIFGNTYQLSTKLLLCTYFYNVSYLVLTTWRFYFVYKNFNFYKTSIIYGLFLKYEPLLNLIYSFVIVQPIFSRNGRKKLLKCMNLLREIKLKASSLAEKRIFYVVITCTLILTLCVEIIEIKYNNTIAEMTHLECLLTLWMTWLQVTSLMFCLMVYCVTLDRLELLAVDLKNISEVKKLKQLANYYGKCVTLIHTFDRLKFFVLRNVWLHCVFDIVVWYKGSLVYWKEYINGETQGMETVANVVASLWILFCVPFAIFVFFLGQTLQDKVTSNFFIEFL